MAMMKIRLHSRKEDYNEFDLYLTLNLDEEEVRSRKLRNQDRVIAKAFRQLIRLYHPDLHPGINNVHAQQITHAYNILKKRKTRKSYHKLSDSRKNFTTRFKEIFFSRTCTSKEKWKRRILFAGSCLLVLGGLGLCIGTAGLGLPIVLACGAATGACINAGFFGAKRILCIDTIETLLDCQGFATSLLIGGGFGALAGLATAGIGVALSEVLTIGIAEISFLEELIVNAPGDAIHGGLSSIASDTIKTVVDQKPVTKRDFVVNALLGAFTNMCLAGQIRRFTCFLRDALILVSKGDTNLSDKCRSHVYNSIKIGHLAKDTAERNLGDPGTDFKSRTEFTRGAAKMNLEDDEDSEEVSDSSDENDESDDRKEWDESGVITYHSGGFYFTRMRVKYLHGGKTEESVMKGSGSFIEIPEMATDIEVKFQVMRFIGIWTDVKKWNRKSESWIEPTESHIFRYPRPVRHIFTLDGTLYYEAVIKVTDDESCQLRPMET